MYVRSVCGKKAVLSQGNRTMSGVSRHSLRPYPG